jgi:hypothetical protein
MVTTQEKQNMTSVSGVACSYESFDVFHELDLFVERDLHEAKRVR